jgi:hypothetical protein
VLVWTDAYPGYSRHSKHNPYGYSAQEVIRVVTNSNAGGAKLLAEADKQEAKVVRAESKAEQWAVVRDECNLFVIGQLVGNGFTVKFDPEPAEPVQVCLAVRFDIPQDAVAYPYKDFANAREDGSVGWPLTLDVTAASDNSPYCAFINNSGTYFPIMRRDFTAGDYTLPFVMFLFMMFVCCACTFFARSKTTAGFRVKPRTMALWTCATCFISAVMVTVLIPAMIPGQCPPVSGWGYVYGFGGLCVMGCVISTFCTVCVCLKGDGETENLQQTDEPQK